MRPSLHITHRTERKSNLLVTPARILKPIDVPFTVTGISAVLACPALLCLDVFSGAEVMLGSLYMLVLLFISNERRSLIGMFAAVAVVSLAASLRSVYTQDGSEMAAMDKIIAMIGIPLFAFGFIRRRTLQLKARKRKAICTVKFAPVFSERIALAGEYKSAFRHIHTSRNPIDTYTRELIWFVYIKSPKN